MRKITYLCLFAPCSTRHNCVILCTYFVYFRNAQSYLFVLFRAMREMTIFNVRKVTYLCYFAPCAKVYIFSLFSKCAKLHICVISRHARNDKILQPYIHRFGRAFATVYAFTWICGAVF